MFVHIHVTMLFSSLRACTHIRFCARTSYTCTLSQTLASLLEPFLHSFLFAVTLLNISRLVNPFKSWKENILSMPTYNIYLLSFSYQLHKCHSIWFFDLIQVVWIDWKQSLKLDIFHLHTIIKFREFYTINCFNRGTIVIIIIWALFERQYNIHNSNVHLLNGSQSAMCRQFRK